MIAAPHTCAREGGRRSRPEIFLKDGRMLGKRRRLPPFLFQSAFLLRHLPLLIVLLSLSSFYLCSSIYLSLPLCLSRSLSIPPLSHPLSLSFFCVTTQVLFQFFLRDLLPGIQLPCLIIYSLLFFSFLYSFLQCLCFVLDRWYLILHM